MGELVDGMRNERDRPAVLAHTVLRIRSESPDAYVFIFEGVEDVGVYEQWLRASALQVKYEPVLAAGKKQILGYMRSLCKSSSQLLMHVYGFVDRDFDLEVEDLSNLHDLCAHSFESLICSAPALESLLMDEFKCSAYPSAQKEVISKFEKVFAEAKSAMLDMNFLLFASQRSGSTVIKKPEKLSHFMTVNLYDIQPKFTDATSVVLVDLKGANLAALRAEFDSLDDLMKFRGKYLYMIFKKWVDLLFIERSKGGEGLFKDVPKLSNAGSCPVTHRRLAGAIDPPKSFKDFVAEIGSSVIGDVARGEFAPEVALSS